MSIEKSIKKWMESKPQDSMYGVTDSETAKWALVKDENGENVVRMEPICDDCIVGVRDRYGDPCYHYMITESGDEDVWVDDFNYCPICGRKLC